MASSMMIAPTTPSPRRSSTTSNNLSTPLPPKQTTPIAATAAAAEKKSFHSALDHFDISADVVNEATAEARRVIIEEARGLELLAETITESFCRAASALLSIPGRIIITGLGKSGHIGRKIASTMASTGSPAFFLHPGDFNHGELGAVNRGDAVIMLSRSGDVPELMQTIARCHRLEIPLVAITAKCRSKLAQAANVNLLIPDIPEACPHGLAPTTSATCMLALGDALSMYMMKRRQFTGDDFRGNHPGGNIGRRALSIREILQKTDGGSKSMAPTVFLATRLNEAMTVMLCSALGMAGVIDDSGKLTDVLTDSGVGIAMLDQLPANSSTVADALEHLKNRYPNRFLLSVDEFSTNEDCQVVQAVAKMNQRKLPGLFVVNESGYAIGFLPLNLCLEAGITASC